MKKIKSGALTVFLLTALPAAQQGCGGGGEDFSIGYQTPSVKNDIEGSSLPTAAPEQTPAPAAASEPITIPSGPS